MSRLVTLDPDITLIKEPEGYQFGKQVGSDDNVTDVKVKLVSLAPVTSASNTGNPMDPIPGKDTLYWGISPEEIIQRQKADKFCRNIRNRIVKALINTGAGRCCLNEEQYQTLGSLPLEPVDVGFWL